MATGATPDHQPDRQLDITVDDFVMFCERTIDFMVDTLAQLDDHQVVQRPAVAGMNSPYGLVTHALGACEWWTGHVLCGRPSDRDRDSEFTAVGTVEQLVASCEAAKDRLRTLAPDLLAAHLHIQPTTQTPLPRAWTVGAALIHAYEELAQHLGHLQITTDLILADSA